MASEVLESVSAKVYYANGNSSDGTLIRVYQSVPTLSGSGYDLTKLFTVMTAMMNICSKTFNAFEASKKYVIEPNS